MRQYLVAKTEIGLWMSLSLVHGYLFPCSGSLRPLLHLCGLSFLPLPGLLSALSVPLSLGTVWCPDRVWGDASCRFPPPHIAVWISVTASRGLVSSSLKTNSWMKIWLFEFYFGDQCKGSRRVFPSPAAEWKESHSNEEIHWNEYALVSSETCWFPGGK